MSAGGISRFRIISSSSLALASAHPALRFVIGSAGPRRAGVPVTPSSVGSGQEQGGGLGQVPRDPPDPKLW